MRKTSQADCVKGVKAIILGASVFVAHREEELKQQSPQSFKQLKSSNSVEVIIPL